MKQNTAIVTSPEFKSFVQSCTETYSAPSKSRDDMAATEKEITNAMLAFVETHRIQPVMVQDVELIQDKGEDGNPLFDADGNPVMIESPLFDADNQPVMIEKETDIFELEIKRELALRGSTVRTSSKEKKIAELEAQLAELQAKLAANA